MVMLYEGGLKKLTTTRYPAYPVMSYSVSRTGYVVGYVVKAYVCCLMTALNIFLFFLRDWIGCGRQAG
jgi:hypothetical protein